MQEARLNSTSLNPPEALPRSDPDVQWKDSVLAPIAMRLMEPLAVLARVSEALQVTDNVSAGDWSIIQTVAHAGATLSHALNELTIARNVSGASEPSPIKIMPLSAAASISKRKVLLVDDYEPNLMVGREMLERFGYSFDVARDGREAIESFLTNKYDAILMDVQMRGVDGLEATRSIRDIERRHNYMYTPIIAITANVSLRDKQECLDSGMDDFIPKPLNPTDLAVKLKRATETRAYQKAAADGTATHSVISRPENLLLNKSGS